MGNPPRSLGAFFSRHPLIRDAIVWSIPAVLVGLVWRLMLMNFSPYAYYGSDSKSFFGFAYGLLAEGEFSLYDKRRYVYPIFLLPVSLLPGSPLKWLAWVQHAFGLLTLVPLAYTVRKIFAAWRWLVIPVTVLYASLPMIIWYEHEMIGETIFFAGVVWAIAGWAAWQGEKNIPRAHRLFWWFFGAFAVVMLTKPSARFFVPGIFLALVAVAAWRKLNFRHGIAAVVLFGLAATVGQESQGSWLLYFSSFPLTRLDTPLHAEYKAEAREKIERMRERIDEYYLIGDEIFEWLDAPEDFPQYPKWAALDKDSKFKSKLYKDLAMEGIKARPDLFLYIALQRLAASANPKEFKDSRFTTAYYPEKFESMWNYFREKKPEYLKFLLALSKDKPLPPYEEVARMISPHPDSGSAAVMHSYVVGFNRVMAVVREPVKVAGEKRSLGRFQLAVAGWWMVAGALLTLIPGYWRTAGVWTVIMGGYLVGVFLVGGDNARYFGAAWPVMVLWLAMPLELLLRGILKLRRDA